MVDSDSTAEQEQEHGTNTTSSNAQTTTTTTNNQQSQQPQQPQQAQPQQHHPPRTKTKHSRPVLHSRTSARAVHRYAPASKAVPEKQSAAASGHRRSASDIKDKDSAVKESKAPKDLTASGSTTASAAPEASGATPADQQTPATETPTTTTPPAANSRKNLSQTNLARPKNKSHVDVRRKNRSAEKLRRTTSNNGSAKAPPTSARAQVHFALGNDGDEEGEEDEWIDASGSASPHLSRNASVKSERSVHSSSRKPADSNEESEAKEPALRITSSQDLTTSQHKEYLTSRLLQRTPSFQHVAPPKISPLMASASQTTTPQPSTAPTAVPNRGSSTTYETRPPNSSAVAGSQGEGLTSRFVAPNSGISGEGSFYNPALATPSQAHGAPHPETATGSLPTRGPKIRTGGTLSDDEDERALAPKPSRRFPVPGTGDNYRTQKKLELQRASAVIEPGQTAGSATGISSLVGFGGPGFDSGGRADPRVTKLLERTGMEYLVVRRYQNPVGRSFRRLAQLELSEKLKQVPRTNTGLSIEGRHGDALGNGKAASGLGSHVRNGSLPDNAERRSGLKRPGLSRAVSTTEVVDYDGGRPGERFAIGDMADLMEEGIVEGGEDQVTMLLRSLWDQPSEYGICQ